MSVGGRMVYSVMDFLAEMLCSRCVGSSIVAARADSSCSNRVLRSLAIQSLAEPNDSHHKLPNGNSHH
jgi:hypothetical protein